MEIVENILPVEYYSELSGVMVDSAVILDNIKLSLTNLYEHLKKYKIDICLNNVIFKWLVTLFFENTDESIYTPVMDSLIVYGDITLYKASILILYMEQNNIMKCTNLCDASIYFDQNLRQFKNKKFNSYLLSKDLIDLNKSVINKLREKKFPKIKDNIKQINEFESKKKKNESDTTCNIDWPYCIKSLGSTNINDVIKHKLYDKPLIEENYFTDDIKRNVYKLAENAKEENMNYLKKTENEKDEVKKRTIIYGNLLINRPFHKCEKHFSSRKEILRDNSGKKSSLMGTFFESFKKQNNNTDTRNISNSEEELMNIISSKNEIDHNTFIENIMADNNNEEIDDKDDLNKSIWFNNMPIPKEDN